jgi:hypothetical protein
LACAILAASKAAAASKFFTAYDSTTGLFTVAQPAYTDITGTPTLPNFVDTETPTGAVDGVNAVFTIAHVPSPTSSLKIWNDGGQLLKAGGVDYTLTGATIRPMALVAVPAPVLAPVPVPGS